MLKKNIVVYLFCVATLFSADAYDVIMENEDLDDVSKLYISYIEMVVSKLSDNVDPVAMGNIYGVVRAELDSAVVYDELKEVIAATLKKRELKKLQKMYDTNTHKTYRRILTSRPSNPASGDELLQEVQRIHTLKGSEQGHPLLTYLNMVDEAFEENHTAPLKKFFAKILPYMNTQRPPGFQLDKSVVDALLEVVETALDYGMHDITLLGTWYQIDKENGTILKEYFDVRFSRSYVSVLKKIEAAKIAYLEEKMQKIIEKLGE